jgi:hypothetical protein
MEHNIPPEQALSQLMSDPHYAAQLTLMCLYGVCCTELVRAGTSEKDIHAMADIVIHSGVLPSSKEVTPWIFLLAYATEKFINRVGASPQEVHQILNMNLAQVKHGPRPS